MDDLSKNLPSTINKVLIGKIDIDEDQEEIKDTCAKCGEEIILSPENYDFEKKELCFNCQRTKNTIF